MPTTVVGSCGIAYHLIGSFNFIWNLGLYQFGSPPHSGGTRQQINLLNNSLSMRELSDYELSNVTGQGIAFVMNGWTKTSPFGHSATSTTGAGVYSFGNSTPLGSSFSDYLLNQAQKRDTTVLVFNNTSKAQDQAALSYWSSFPTSILTSTWPDSCAHRSAEGFKQAGFTLLDTGLPNDIYLQLKYFYTPKVYSIPQGSKTPPQELYEFNPR